MNSFLQLHTSRKVAACLAALCYVGAELATWASAPFTHVYVIVAAVVMVLAALSARPAGQLLAVMCAALAWALQEPYLSEMSVVAGSLTFCGFVAAHLAGDGVPQSPLPPETMTRWGTRSAIVLVLSGILTELGMLLSARHIHGSLLAATLVLLALGALLLWAARQADSLR